MDKSESIKELANALCKAQSQIKGAVKDSTNPHFRSKYADLASVVDAIKEAATSVGLSWVQVMHDSDAAARVETVIMHSSGEWLSCGVLSVPVSKQDAQGMGSALTYARRYSLSAAFGVAPEDDDGNAASAAAPSMRGKGVIKPTDGAMETQDPETQKRIQAIADGVNVHMATDRVYDAYELITQAALDADQMVALWSLIPNSTYRRKLKEFAAQAEK